MRALAQLAARLYGERLFHLIVVLAALALGGYVISVLGVRNLFISNVWWQSIAVWFAVAVIGHDLMLFPLYALADRLLRRSRSSPDDADGAPQHPPRRMPSTNYIRMPTLAAGLLLLMFLPGIIEQGAPTYQAATGQTQAPYLARWLLLTAAFYLASAVCYAVRTLLRQRNPITTPATSRATHLSDDPQAADCATNSADTSTASPDDRHG